MKILIRWETINTAIFGILSFVLKWLKQSLELSQFNQLFLLNTCIFKVKCVIRAEFYLLKIYRERENL